MTHTNADDWPSLAGLIVEDGAFDAAILGAPMNEGAVTAGRCDLAPEIFRNVLRRISTYDIETETDLIDMRLHDAGDIDLAGISPADSFDPIRSRAADLAKTVPFVTLIGGNNAITRPGVHAVSDNLASTGLITLDAHFDLRPTEHGLINGNPVQALLDDGLPGENIVQIGLAPFCNTSAMHQTAKSSGISVVTIGECERRGITAVMEEALDRIARRCDKIYVDFDIDVIDRPQLPGAPGARPGGLSTTAFFEAATIVGAHPKVSMVDLTEFDPWLDVSDISALVAGRWMASLLAGVKQR